MEAGTEVLEEGWVLMTTISVLIITYNRKDDLRKTIKSIKEQTRKPDEIIIVDNASTDGTAEMVRKEYPELKLLVSPENRGLTYGVNLAYSNSIGDIAAVLESDMEFDKNWVEEVVREFDRDPEAGAVVPRFLHRAANGYVDVEFPPDENNNLERINGCWCLRREIFEKHNELPYDSDYFLYAQEPEASARIFNMGYKIRRIWTTTTYHNQNLSTGRTNLKTLQFFQTRNTFWNLWTFYSKRNIAVYTPVYVVYFLLTFKGTGIKHILHGIFSSLLGIPKCLKKRQVVDKPRFESIMENWRFIRKVQKTYKGFKFPKDVWDKRDKEATPESNTAFS